MAEIEGKGLDYERYALNKLFKRLVHTYGIRNVLEIPAKGEKAMPSIYSIAFGEAGCEVTLVNAEEKSKGAWQKLGYPVTYRQCDDLTRSGLEDDDRPQLLHERGTALVPLALGYFLSAAGACDRQLRGLRLRG